MKVECLDHYNITTADAAKSAQFYIDVLGLEIGPRPDFGFPGLWVYAGNQPVLHLVEKKEVAAPGTGRLDHIALRASGYAEIKGRLDERGVNYKVQTVPGPNLTQLFLETPDSLWIELIFQPEDAAAAA